MVPDITEGSSVSCCAHLAILRLLVLEQGNWSETTSVRPR